MGKNERTIDLSDTIKVISWNRRILNVVGIWPLKVYDGLFLPLFVYMVLHCSLTFADLFDTPKSLDDILANVSENALFMMALGKITYCRLNRRSIAQLLIEIEKDFMVEKYKMLEEREIFFKYNRSSCRYILVAVPTMIVCQSLYYTKTMMVSIEMAIENSSVDIHLPFRTRVFVDVHNTRNYFCIAIVQSTVMIIVVFGYVGLDCLFAFLAFHIAAQFAILRCNIRDTLQNTTYFRQSIKTLILKHYRVIRLAESLEDDFNIIILQQLLGTVIHICISIYNWIAIRVDNTGQSIQLLCFVLYGFNTMLTLFVYCYIGECLIQESVNFGEAFYHYEWYNISPVDLKLIQICMVRSRKPLQLTSGKFCALSLCTFTDTLDFTRTSKVLTWNRRSLECMGIWPEKVRDLIFVFFFVYLLIHCTCAFADIAKYAQDFGYVSTSLTENVFLVMTLVKISVCRIRRKSLANFLRNIAMDFQADRYESNAERSAFLSYNNFSFKFITMTMITSVITATTYYIMGLVGNLESVKNISSIEYKLPYKSRPFIEPHDKTTYVCLCMYQFFVVPIIVFGYVGTDCFFISLVLHVSGQFSALSQKVKHVLENENNRRSKIKNLIRSHHRLIRLANSLERQFNVIVLQQLTGTTFHLCLSGYHALSSSTDGHHSKLFTFFLVAGCVISTLLAYCYTGECLINESVNFGEAIYHSRWYDISAIDLKLIHICMIRTSKPSQLTSGKFCTLSLSTFTDVVKTSLAYLSVLRSLF